MSHPDHVQPPATPWPPSPGPGPRTRAPWVVAALAAVVAVAAVVALVVVLVGGGDDVAGGASERSFDSPEEAVTFLVDRLADGETGEAAESFVVEPLVEGYSFEAQAERLGAVPPDAWLPGLSDGYDEINVSARRGEVATEVSSVVRSILAPERDQTVPTTLGDDLTAEDLAAELSPDPLSELAVARVDEIDRSDASYVAVLEQQAAVYEADELRVVGMLLDTAEGQMMGGATVARYGDDWAVMSLSAPILDTPPLRLVPASEEDYLDAVESARGSDG